jgi:hypothetical protein
MKLKKNKILEGLYNLDGFEDMEETSDDGPSIAG